MPARALQELARIAQQSASESVAVSVGQNQVVFELGEVVLSSRLIDGSFPTTASCFRSPSSTSCASPAPS